MEQELIDLMKKFIREVEASPNTWRGGYPELANEYRQAIEAAELRMAADGAKAPASDE